MAVAARPFGYVGSQPRLRTWLQIGFWIVSGIMLLTLNGAQFGPAATISILAITVTKSTPNTLGALAGIRCERSGVVNIGIEGMMLTAAFSGFMAGVYTHNLGIALVAAIGSGALMALLHAVLSITFRVDQIISGTVVNILAVGLTGYLNRQLFATGAPPGLSVLPSIPFGLLSDLPWIGPIVFQQKPIALTAIVLVVVLHLALFRTRLGVRTRAVDEHPLAADTVRINGNPIRHHNVVLGGALAGLGGGCLNLESCAHFERLS